MNVGVTFRTRNAEEVAEIVSRTTRAFEPALSKGALRLPIVKVYRIEEASAAFERIARNKHFGTLILANQ